MGGFCDDPNKVNFPLARRKGSIANRKIAEGRLGEFAVALNRVDPHRELTAREIAGALNKIGFKPPQSKTWTPVNVGRVMGNLKAHEAREAHVQTILASSPPMFDAGGGFTEEGRLRWETALDRKRIEIEGKGIELDTFKKLGGLSARQSFTESQRKFMENWVADQEALNSVDVR